MNIGSFRLGELYGTETGDKDTTHLLQTPSLSMGHVPVPLLVTKAKVTK